MWKRKARLVEPRFCHFGHGIGCFNTKQVGLTWGWNFKELGTAQQSQVHPRFSNISNIELGGLTWGLLYFPAMCMHREARPQISLKWQDLRLNAHTQNDWKFRIRAFLSVSIICVPKDGLWTRGGSLSHTHGRRNCKDTKPEMSSLLMFNSLK